MQDLEYTPSVYFPDRTANKTNLSAELLFELTGTAQKQACLPIDTVPNLIHLSPKAPPPPHAKLKTDDFFEEFQNNFVVTFEEERAPVQEDLVKTATFHLEVESHCLHHSKTTEVEMDAERRRDSFGELKLLSLRTGMSLMNHAQLEEKGSPVAFEVKKRTVFKAKENIINNAQNFKLTKKKIFNQNIFDEFAGKSKACPHSIAHSEQSLPSKPRPRKSLHAPSRADLQPRPRSHPSILERHNRGAQSQTLNHWRKRFNREKQAMEGAVKRESIFHIQALR